MAYKSSKRKSGVQGMKVKKVVRNSDGSKTALLSSKGKAASIWYPKGSRKKLVTVKTWK